MVKLEFQSKIDSKQQPFLHQWDSNQRQSYQDYQNSIDRTTYHLQRSQRGLAILGSWAYPRFFQKDILSLELLQKKQQLGKIEQTEVEYFKRFNPSIADDLNKTFSSRIQWPVQGALVGAALFGVGAIFNFRYSFRLGFVLLPMVIDYSYKQFDKTAGIRSLEFLDFVTSYRTQRARQELYALKNPVVANDKAYQGSVWEGYQQIINLVESQAHTE